MSLSLWDFLIYCFEFVSRLLMDYASSPKHLVVVIQLVRSKMPTLVCRTLMLALSTLVSDR